MGMGVAGWSRGCYYYTAFGWGALAPLVPTPMCKNITGH